MALMGTPYLSKLVWTHFGSLNLKPQVLVNKKVTVRNVFCLFSFSLISKLYIIVYYRKSYAALCNYFDIFMYLTFLVASIFYLVRLDELRVQLPHRDEAGCPTVDPSIFENNRTNDSTTRTPGSDEISHALLYGYQKRVSCKNSNDPSNSPW